MTVYDINKSSWCVSKQHARCQGRYCACVCHEEVRA